jgi:hypothetical protein
MAAGVQVVRCQRCMLSLRVGEQDQNEEARLMRLSRTGQGLCVHCSATEFLQHTAPPILIQVIRSKGKECLLNQAFQQQFGAVMKAGFAQAALEAIDWQMVVDNWELQFQGVTKRNSNARLFDA